MPPNLIQLIQYSCIIIIFVLLHITEVIPRYFKLLPAYMPISVSIALSLTLAPDIIYFHTMSEITQIVENYEHNYEAAKKDAAGEQ